MSALGPIRSRFLEKVRRDGRRLFNLVRGMKWSSLKPVEIARRIDRPSPTILEIGCNDGSDTLRFLRAMPDARIYCFEPDPRAIRRFRQQIGSGHDNVKLVEIALSDRTGTIDFYPSSGRYPGGGDDKPEGWDLSGSIRRPKNHLIEYPWVKFDQVMPVQTRRLDDWCAENGVRQVDFIWMDVQGAEGDVIAGAREILKSTRYLYTEYSNRETYEGQLSLKTLLARLPAFKVVARYPNDVLLMNRKVLR